MTGPIAKGWVTTDEAQALTDYARAHVRRLAIRKRVEARRVGRDWLINLWREDLGDAGLGRRH